MNQERRKTGKGSIPLPPAFLLSSFIALKTLENKTGGAPDCAARQLAPGKFSRAA
jgi:hypothetical protein